MIDTLSLIAADDEHPLTGGAKIDVPYGLRGLDMPPSALIAQAVPLQPGARVRRVRVEPREVDLPLEILGESRADLRAELRRWTGRFNPRRPDGSPRTVRLRATTALGDVRDLTCLYLRGLEGQITEDALGFRQRAVVTLYAGDPYWYDATATLDALYTAGSAPRASFLGGRFLPLRLSSSTVFAQPTVDNPGDAEGWPVWTVIGPGVNPVLRNLTTGEYLELALTLLRGERVAIDTRPTFHVGGKTVRHEGKNAFGALSAASALWSLLPGDNSLQLELSGATADSSIRLAFQAPRLGP